MIGSLSPGVALSTDRLGRSSPRDRVCGHAGVQFGPFEGDRMFDTQLTIIGNVLAQPEWRRTTTTNQSAASFRVASTSRRWDKVNNEWVDGQSLRVRVTCWR